jgi:formate transporter
MLRGGAATWAGNLVGGVAMALLVHLSAQYLLGGSAVGTAMVTAAAQKCRLPFGVALLRGVLGGSLVSLAGWLAVRATTVTEKAAATLPFVALAAGGFEYAAINAHLVPLGLLTEGAVGFVDPSLGLLEFVWGNLVPVTIGNGMGAVVTAGLVYWALYGASRGGQGRTGRGALGGERRRRTVPPGRADD